jgi:hypothetical protein
MRIPARLVPTVVISLLVMLGAGAVGAQPSCDPVFLKPALIDTNGDGPTPGTDGTITPLFCPPDTLLIQNPWQDCNGSGAFHNAFLLTFDPKTNQILSISRDRGNEQENVVPTYDPLGNPTEFAMTVNKGGSTAQQGSATLLRDGSGAFSGIFFGPPIDLQLDFVFHFDQNGRPDYMSLPWSQTAAIGVKTNPGCGPASDGSTPQIWVPLVNGTIDVNPVLPGIPPLRVGSNQKIPTLSGGMTLALAASILAAGLFQLRRSGLGF